MLYNVLEQPGTMQRMWEGERALSATICHPPPTLAESKSDQVAEYYKVKGSSLSLSFSHFQNGHFQCLKKFQNPLLATRKQVSRSGNEKYVFFLQNILREIIISWNLIDGFVQLHDIKAFQTKITFWTCFWSLTSIWHQEPRIDTS